MLPFWVDYQVMTWMTAIPAVLGSWFCLQRA
jgi:hypothetical protein